MHAFTSFDGLRIAYHDQGKGPAVILLHGFGVDGLGSSESSNESFRSILAGIGDYAIEDTILELPQSWPVPDSVPRPLTLRVWAEEGARILEKGEIVPGHLASANLIAAWVTGADPKVLAAVIRGAVAPTLPAEKLGRVKVPVLMLNGKADVANQKVGGLLKAIPTAGVEECEGDHHSTPYYPTFQRAVVRFFKQQWRLRVTVSS